jgi:XTP/dITP diphosphohydrolase
MPAHRKIVFASNNPGKVREVSQILAEMGLEVHSQKEFDVPDVPETGLAFVENAIIKARNAARHTGLPAIADDSGIEVDALEGAPGVFSARFAGPGASDADNNCKLLEDLADVPSDERTARYQCLMVYLRHPDDPTPIIAQGTWDGVIAREPKGENGFGYDPYFYVPSEGVTSAQLSAERKNALSHRGIALRRLVDLLRHEKHL